MVVAVGHQLRDRHAHRRDLVNAEHDRLCLADDAHGMRMLGLHGRQADAQRVEIAGQVHRPA